MRPPMGSATTEPANGGAESHPPPTQADVNVGGGSATQKQTSKSAEKN
jgi:hypothetical protein